jgi:hypothetical protein
VVLVLQLLTGCAYIGSGESPEASIDQPSASPNDTPIPTFSLEPTESPEATATVMATTPTAPPSAEPTPLPSPSFVEGMAASDQFWNTFYETCFFGAFRIPSSLDEVVRHANVVMRGEIVDMHEAQVGHFTVVNASVAPAEVLKGEPVVRGNGTVKIQIGYDAQNVDQLRSQIPDHDQLWFLQPTEDGAGYYPDGYLQLSVLRNIDGTVRVIWPDAIARAYSPHHYPVPLEGTNFEDLLVRVREIVSNRSSGTSLALKTQPSRTELQGLFAC